MGMSRQALVVDDSRATRALLKRMLTSFDFDVAEAGHGVEGLERLNERPATELALVDWNMPEMDGLEFIKAVRADRAWDGVKVVMVTSENEPARIARALMAGADEYAMKPCTADALAEKLELAGVTAVRS
jgi:two-component system chemotaxis response regulator CheY